MAHHSLSGISYKHHRLYEPERDKDDFYPQVSGSKPARRNRMLETSFALYQGMSTESCGWFPRSQSKTCGDRRNLLLRSGIVKVNMASSSPIFTNRREGLSRHESHLLALLIGNLITHKEETLAKNVQGYDHRMQVESVRRLFEIIDGVRQWASEK